MIGFLCYLKPHTRNGSSYLPDEFKYFEDKEEDEFIKQYIS